MSGHYRMARGWMDHPVFANEPFTEREAWQWLIEQAAFKARTFRIGRHVVPIERGQLVTSLRYLAAAWQWNRSRTYRFLNRLEIGTGGEPMIETVSGTEHTIITICNYDEYQGEAIAPKHETEQPSEHDLEHERNTSETKQKELESKDKYIYRGRVVRLVEKDYDRWKTAYAAIPDFDAELARIDDALAERLKPGEAWFPAASAMLAAKHQRISKDGLPNGRGPPSLPRLSGEEILARSKW